MAEPAARADIAVVIPTRDRETRLAFALEALGEQTLGCDRFEVVVVRDVDDSGPYARPPEGLRVRTVTIPRSLGLAAKREAGWRASDAPLIAFTDDDCRPDRRWLAALAEAAATGDGAGEVFVQGLTDVDPDESHLLFGLARTQRVLGPNPWYETCNVAYPRTLLESVGGFDPAFSMGGEDTDLALRSLAAGARRAYAPEARVWHAVHPPRTAIRARARWTTMPRVVAVHGDHRRHFFLSTFQTPSHAAIMLAAAAIPLARNHRGLAFAAAAPWLVLNTRKGDLRPRRLLRHALHLPARAAVDAAETAATIRSAIRQRVLMA